MNRIIILLVPLVACHHGTPEPVIGPWPIPATVHASADDPGLLAMWDAEVQWNVGDMNFGLSAAAQCSPPFVIVGADAPADHEIRLVGNKTWLEPGMVGGETDGDDGAIFVYGKPTGDPYTDPLRGTISHELGHAMGLGHADPSFGLSMMTVPPDVQERARDADALGCLLGCPLATCAPNADPYDSP